MPGRARQAPAHSRGSPLGRWLAAPLWGSIAYCYAEEFWPRWVFEPLRWLVEQRLPF